MPGPILAVARPLLPKAERLAPYLERIDQRRWYSNFGPLAQELETRCADEFGLAPGQVLTTSSGTLALWAGLTALGGQEGGVCLLPSWTFGATAAAVVQAGFAPHFIDVDPKTWALDPAHAARRAKALNARVIVPVAPFGAAVDFAAWGAVARETGAHILADAAAGFDFLTRKPALHGVNVIVSLHATKALPAGEGGLFISENIERVQLARRFINFGCLGDRLLQVRGFNGKMSEYNAAIGLASLDQWPARRAAWRERHEMLRAALSGFAEIGLGPDAAGDFAVSTFNTLFPCAPERAQLLLVQRGVQSVRWWGVGCADQPAYAHAARDRLPATEALAQQAVGLPMFPDMSEKHCAQIRRAAEGVLAAAGRAASAA